MVIGRLIGGVILALSLNISASAEPPTTAVIGTPPQPAWNQLSVQQKSTLAPLSKEWDGMENIRKKKWLGIADRYPTMKPDEQQRMRDRMQEWATFSSLERTRIRDAYKDFKQLPPEQKLVIKQKWDAYSSLPPEEKQRIRETGKSSKLLTTPAPQESSGQYINIPAASGSSGAPAQ